ncbi:MAG: alpha/beta hydrolase [Dehalococcoidia bacterium]|jgi:alpha-beta hydrolase superfamily lysophospholipase|nr:MAG: alpha/beta hydrolase [Dehalococcoidia bacterium]
MTNSQKHIEYNYSGQRYRIYYQGWLPEQDPKAILVVVHGLAEHGGRYRRLAERLVTAGYGVFALDHQGHGRSQGRPGYVVRFEEYLSDIKIFCDILRGTYPGIRIFLLGHSLGGTIATAYAIRHQEEIAGLALSGATLKPGKNVSRMMVTAARLLGQLLPRLGVSLIDVDLLSRDPAVVAAYLNDPLVHHGKISYRLGAEILRGMEKIRRDMSRLKLPMLIMYGTADRLCDPAGSEMLFNGVGSDDLTIKRYAGLYHEIFNEPEYATVFNDLKNWLDRL